ncbi:transmembrane protease serine 9-like [Haematobia irritans]|uniref:transmembrane protease serine 9-like n=1 Tax=Haematobia irritans TaxID=7368 RepID=UPI003F4FEDB6
MEECLILNVLILGTLSLFVWGSIHSEELADKRSARIIGGIPISISDAKFVVYIRSRGRYKCVGSLVTQRHVVTAAHCVDTEWGVRSLTVTAGATFLTEAGIQRSVHRIYIPRNYHPSSLHMDLAVLELHNDIYGINISTIGLCNTTNLSDVYVYGWGSTRYTHLSNRLRMVKVPLIPFQTCIDYFSRLITPTMFCAGDLSYRDSCYGDSGGPAVYKNQLCGVVSWGPQCAGKTYPGVYTNVSYMRTFIENTFHACSFLFMYCPINILNVQYHFLSAANTMSDLVLYSLIIFLSTVCARTKLRHENEPRIIGGEEVTIAQVPYLVNLRRNGQFFCGGSLITPQCILTAAHCVYNVPVSSLMVSAGASRLSDYGEMRQVTKSYVSALFSPTNLDMDVALLRLREPFQNPNIATIPLCSTNLEEGDQVRISGWGYTSESNSQPSDQVRSALVRVTSRNKCLQAYAGKAKISNTMFCASVSGEKDSCSGDSGGPVVHRGHVCGIVSWGFGCARAEFPGVYTNVASLRVNAYIKNVLLQNCM